MFNIYKKLQISRGTHGSSRSFEKVFLESFDLCNCIILLLCGPYISTIFEKSRPVLFLAYLDLGILASSPFDKRRSFNLGDSFTIFASEINERRGRYNSWTKSTKYKEILLFPKIGNITPYPSFTQFCKLYWRFMIV